MYTQAADYFYILGYYILREKFLSYTQNLFYILIISRILVTKFLYIFIYKIRIFIFM